MIMPSVLMRVLPLLLAWVGCFGLCRELAARKRILADWRVSWILACAFWGALLTLVVEGCSAMRQLNAATVFIVWTILGTSLAGAAFSLARKRGDLSRAALAQLREVVHGDWKECWPLDAKLMLAASAALILLLAMLAFVFPTTNLDSLTYHQPRVMHWIQQQSVEHYPTSNTRQIEFGPWAGYVILHLHLLSGSDHLDNLVQWFAMLTSLIVATFIAQQLIERAGSEDGSVPNPDSLRKRHRLFRRTSALACVLVTTLPIGMVESITAQTDHVVTCWFMGLTCLLLALWGEPDNLWYALGAGVALGLGVLTKATMLIYAAPLGMFFAARWLCVQSSRLRLRLALTFIACLAALNTAHWWRNFCVFDSPLGSRYIMSIERNAELSLGGTFSNLIRNLSLQSNTGIPPLTAAINKLLIQLHRLSGKDVNASETTYHLGRFVWPERFLIHDSYASCFYHLLLILIATVLVARQPKENLVWLGYGLSAVGGFILFCVLLRWQQWHSRVHMAWLIFLTPLTAATLAARLPAWSTRTIAMALLLFAMFCLASNKSRPLLHLGPGAFSREIPNVTLPGTELYGPMSQVAHDIILSGCKEVGLKIDFDHPEYPVWILLRKQGFTGRIDHVWVENESARKPTSTPPPCLLLCTSLIFPTAMTNQFPYQAQHGPIQVFYSERASRWAELAQLTNGTRTARWLPRERGRVELERKTVTFGLRSPRAGRLELAGILTDAKGTPLATDSFRISTRSGFEQTVAVTGQPVRLTVPSGGGPCVIELECSRAEGASNVVWDKLRWNWEPEDSWESLPR